MEHGGRTQRRVNGAHHLMLGKQTIQVNSQDQIVQSGNYCYVSLRVLSIDEVKIKPSKDYHDSHVQITSSYTQVKKGHILLGLEKKHNNVKTVSLCNKRNPTNANAQELKKVRNELIKAYLKEQNEFIQDLINKIRTSVEDR